MFILLFPRAAKARPRNGFLTQSRSCTSCFFCICAVLIGEHRCDRHRRAGREDRSCRCALALLLLSRISSICLLDDCIISRTAPASVVCPVRGQQRTVHGWCSTYYGAAGSVVSVEARYDGRSCCGTWYWRAAPLRRHASFLQRLLTGLMEVHSHAVSRRPSILPLLETWKRCCHGVEIDRR